MKINENTIFVLNPDYHFKNDIDRIVMYSRNQTSYNASSKWVSYIHPFQAIFLSLFTHNIPLKEQISNISKHFHISYQDALDLILPYINNSKGFHTIIGSQKIFFPKNVLIPIERIKESIYYNFNIIDFKLDSIDLTNDRMHRAPNSILFMLNNKCVTDCQYCYANKKTQYTELTTNQILNLIKEASKLDIAYIDVIGGELFCKKDWHIILKELVRLKMTPSYISTKVPINQNIVKKLHETGYNNVIQISLDSLNESSLKKIIKCDYGYIKKLKNGINFLQEYGFKIQIDTILTKYNSNKESITELFNYIKDIKNLIYWEIRIPEASIYTPNTFSEIKATYKDLVEICSFINTDIKTKSTFKIHLTDSAITTKFNEGSDCDKCFQGGECGYLTNHFFVLPDGKVSACEQLYWHPQFIIGDLTKQSIQEVWNSPKALSLRNIPKDQIRPVSLCKNCQIYDFCNSNHRKCIVKVIKAYGTENWDYPDPRCQYAPRFESDLKYK